MKTTKLEPVADHIRPDAELTSAPRDDRSAVIEAALAGDVDEMKAAMGAVDKRRRFTYTRAMAEAGIERGSVRHRQSFEHAMMWLYEHRPYYAYCMRRVTRVMTHTTPTLAIGFNGGRLTMYINPDFVAIHNLQQNVGFIQHEIGHAVHGHCEIGRQDGPAHFADPINNIAMDLAVDDLINAVGDQPPWVLLPEKLRIPDDNVPESQWKPFPRRASWMTYKNLLLDIRERHRRYYDANVKKRLSALPENDDGITLESFDDHGLWDQDGDNQLMSAAIRAMATGAYADTVAAGGGGKMAGYMSGEMIERINELMKTRTLPFSSLFDRAVATYEAVNRAKSVKRMSKRTRKPPGATFSRRLDVLWLRDTSGSMESEELALMFNEIWRLAQDENVRVRVQDFDYGLRGPLRDLSESDARCARDIYGRGGTDFVAPLNLASELRPDVVIVHTDGYATVPARPNLYVVWALSHRGRVPEWGTLLQLPSVADIRDGHKAVIDRWG